MPPLYIQILIALVLGAAFGAQWAGAAGYVAFLGTIFIHALKMIIAPLVLASIVCGVAGLGDVRRLGPMGARTVAYYLVTTFMAVVIGLVLVNVVRPGVPRSEAARAAMDNYRAKVDVKKAKAQAQTVSGFLKKQIDKMLCNPFHALANGNVLGVIVFSLLLGGTLTTMGDKGAPLLRVFQSLNAAMLQLTGLIMRFAPLGVFGLMADFVAEARLEGLKALAAYMATVTAGLLVHAVVVLPLLLYVFGRRSALTFAGQMRSALMIAFTTASSSATLPVTIDCAEKKAGVRTRVAGFVLPLGATINMDGTALYEAVAAMFIAQLFGIDMSFMQQVLIFLTATLAAIGAAGIPSAGTVTMAMVLTAVGLPMEGIAIIVGVDRVLDMCRTTVNVWGDAVGAAVVGRYEPESS